MRAADMYYSGVSISKNLAVAFQLYHTLALKGNVSCQNKVGLMYTDGEGTEQSDKEALIWLNKAVNNGCEEAMTIIANIHYVGRSVQKKYNYLALVHQIQQQICQS